MSASAVKDIDRGWARIRRELRQLDGAYTKVGLQTGAEHADPQSGDLSDLVMIGAVHEFGTRRIPQRSWLRTAFDSNRTAIQGMKTTLFGKVLENRMSPLQAFQLLGEFFQAKVRANIVKIKSPANAPSTIARKGSTNPLIDTSQMLQSVRHVEVGV